MYIDFDIPFGISNCYFILLFYYCLFYFIILLFDVAQVHISLQLSISFIQVRMRPIEFTTYDNFQMPFFSKIYTICDWNKKIL